jgi:multiple sugar transport system permease protein
LGVVSQGGGDVGGAGAQNMASAILAALPLVLVFVFSLRQIIKGIATTGFGGQ